MKRTRLVINLLKISIQCPKKKVRPFKIYPSGKRDLEVGRERFGGGNERNRGKLTSRGWSKSPLKVRNTGGLLRNRR